MKHQTILCGVALAALAACSPHDHQQAAPAIERDARIEQRIDSVMRHLTIEEKIGQMTQLNLSILERPAIAPNATKDEVIAQAKSLGLDKQFDFSQPIDDQTFYLVQQAIMRAAQEREFFVFDEAKLDSVFGKYKVGSILNTPAATPNKEQWNAIISRIQQKSIEEIGIPCVYGLDQNHGTTYTNGGTLFPQPINIAATFDTQMAHDAAVITAYETRASDCPWTFCPTLDLGRIQTWPRLWENYGEDPYLSAQMGEAAVRGFQGEDPNHVSPNNIAVSIKHFMGYSAPVSGKDRTPAVISLPDLKEKHFAPFVAAIRAGALTVMVNSSSVNGVPMHANYELLTKWLKEGLNWDGMVITDWADINQLTDREKVADGKKEAIQKAINAGIDMSMDPYSWDFCVLLKQLVDEGKVSVARIDDACRRVLRLKFRLGLFDAPNTWATDYPAFADADKAAKALQIAEESMVLLKNDDAILPLAKGKKILVCGPNANQMRCLNGGWSYSWQGDATDRYTEEYNTIYEAMVQKFGQQYVSYVPGVCYNEHGAHWAEDRIDIPAAVAAARKADVVVACVGENSYCETPGNIDDISISRNQQALVEALAQTGKPIVMIINGGRPRIVRDIVPLAKGIVDILLPGNYGGDALANLLAGDANFSGRMPYTYPKFPSALVNYDYKVSSETGTMEGAYNYNAVVSAQWLFGYGLSYTTFEYSDLNVDRTEFVANDVINVSVTVKNTGSVAGKESVQLYSSDLVASIVPDVRRLRAFTKVELQPGESQQVTLQLKGSDLAFVDADGRWTLEAGKFKLQIGQLVSDIKCTQTYKWSEANK